MHHMWVFSTPYSMVLITNLSIQVETCFVLEEQTAQHINPLLLLFLLLLLLFIPYIELSSLFIDRPMHHTQYN
jgi:hypothetical protein